MDKYLFLDIDGVIAVESELDESGMWALSLKKQMLLGEIIDKTGCIIVLSSSWRFNTLEKTQSHMTENGFLFTDKLIGITIRAYQWLEKGTKIHLSIPRGVEIKQWMDTHIHSDNGKNWNKKKLGVDYTYVILDDDSDMLLEHKDNFIQTDSTYGLSENDVKKAISILNKTNID